MMDPFFLLSATEVGGGAGCQVLGFYLRYDSVPNSVTFLHPQRGVGSLNLWAYIYTLYERDQV